MATEDVSARYLDLDGWPTGDAVEAMFEGQLAAVAAVRPALPAIGAAADEASAALRRGGRLVYVGAGTSGRVAVQDGAELTPTFDWPWEKLVFSMAGGEKALMKSAEGAEDDIAAAVAKADAEAIGPDDVVIGVAASGSTPYTVAWLKRAAERGAVTIGLANNREAALLSVAGHAIFLDTGAEVIAGSTRMKAGTAQKVALNLLSTMIMIRLGRIYRGMMVQMRVSNAKLRRRAEAMVAAIADCPRHDALEALKKADWDVKLAALVVRRKSPAEARALLDRHHGSLRAALAEAPPPDAAPDSAALPASC